MCMQSKYYKYPVPDYKGYPFSGLAARVNFWQIWKNFQLWRPAVSDSAYVQTM